MPIRKLEPRCSFCAKKQHEVRTLIPKREVFICDECVGICNQALAERVRPRPPPADLDTPLYKYASRQARTVGRTRRDTHEQSR